MTQIDLTHIFRQRTKNKDIFVHFTFEKKKKIDTDKGTFIQTKERLRIYQILKYSLLLFSVLSKIIYVRYILCLNL